MKKLLSITLIFVLCFAFASCGAAKRDESYKRSITQAPQEIVTQPEQTEVYEVTTNKDTKNYPKVEIKVKKYGTIKLQLDSVQAPETVKNFVSLVKKGF